MDLRKYKNAYLRPGDKKMLKLLDEHLFLTATELEELGVGSKTFIMKSYRTMRIKGLPIKNALISFTSNQRRKIYYLEEKSKKVYLFLYPRVVHRERSQLKYWILGKDAHKATRRRYSPYDSIDNIDWED